MFTPTNSPRAVQPNLFEEIDKSDFYTVSVDFNVFNEYERFSLGKLDIREQEQLDMAVSKIKNRQEAYKRAAANRVPWEVLGVIHYFIAGCDLKRSILDGEYWSRPRDNAPNFKTFDESVEYCLNNKKVLNVIENREAMDFMAGCIFSYLIKIGKQDRLFFDYAAPLGYFIDPKGGKELLKINSPDMKPGLFVLANTLNIF